MIQIFQSISGFLAFSGLISNRWSQAHHPFNARLISCFLVIGLSIICNVLYLIFVANTLVECMQCVGIISAVVEIGICFAAIAYQSNYLFECIARTEKTINASKFERKVALDYLKFI